MVQYQIIAEESYTPVKKIFSSNYILQTFVGRRLEFFIQTLGVLILVCSLRAKNYIKVTLYGLTITVYLNLLCCVVTDQPQEPIFYALFYFIFIESKSKQFSNREWENGSYMLSWILVLFLVFQMIAQNYQVAFQQVAIKNIIQAIEYKTTNEMNLSNSSCGISEAIKYQKPIRVGGQDLAFFKSKVELPKHVPLYWHSGVTLNSSNYVGKSLDDVNVIILDYSNHEGSISGFVSLFNNSLEEKFTKIKKSSLCTVLVRNEQLAKL